MAYQTVFKRYEIKYLLTTEQMDRIMKAMEPYMVMDKYGESTIRNIYFDTDDYILARHSIAKPDFKEKLRIRSYARANHNDKVFVELKRKYEHVVYKRRVAMPEEEAMSWTMSGSGSMQTARAYTRDGRQGQLYDEIGYFLSYYSNLRPVMYLSYERQAYRMREEENDFRVTFDRNILCRDYDLSLTSEVYGTPILEEGKVLMELKCPGAIPMWMVKVLSEEKLYKTSFSKYGTAYTTFVLPEYAAGISKRAMEELAASEYSDRNAAGVQEKGNNRNGKGKDSGKRMHKWKWAFSKGQMFPVSRSA